MQQLPFSPFLNPPLNGKFPTGVAIYLPLTLSLLPTVGAGGAVAITRATEKRTQNGDNTIVVDAVNTLSITNGMFGLGAQGLLSEPAATNDCTDGDDLTGGSWAVSDCAVSAKNVVGPSGVGTEAQTLTPSANGGSVQDATAVACASKNALGTVYAKCAAGVADHTGQLVLVDSDGNVTASKDIALTSEWTPYFVEYTGVGAGAETLNFRIVPDKTAQLAADVRLPFVEVFANTSIKTLITPSITTRNVDVSAYDSSGDVNGTVGTFFFKVTLMHDPEDGVTRYYFSCNPLLASGAASDLIFWKGATNTLRANIYIGGGSQLTSAYAATDLTWARGTTHEVGIRYSTSGLDFWIDGVQRGTRGATTVGDASPHANCRIRFHDRVSGNQPGAVLSGVRYWAWLLSDSEMRG